MSDYIAHLKLPQQMLDLAQRRITPFLDNVGMSKSIQHLLIEAYLQGLRDACDALDKDTAE